MRRSDAEQIESMVQYAPAEAVVTLRRSIEDGDNDPDTWAYLAEALSADEQIDEALKAWAHYLTLDPGWPEAYTARAELLVVLGRFEAADVELRMAEELFDDDARVPRARAIWHELQGRFEEAESLYRQAAAIDLTWPVPPRFDRDEARAHLNAADPSLRGLQIAEIPANKEAGDLMRPHDRHDDGGLVIYLRNLERELDNDASLDELTHLLVSLNHPGD